MVQGGDRGQNLTPVVRRGGSTPGDGPVGARDGRLETVIGDQTGDDR